MTELTLIPREEFDRADGNLALLADMCRANALVAVKRAGSGHLGSSFSALDIVVHLLWRELNVVELGWGLLLRLRMVVPRCAALGSLCSSVYLLVGLM